jgi:hypothetical protein
MLPGTPKPGGSAGTSRVASPNYFKQDNGTGAHGDMGSTSLAMGSMSTQPRPQQIQSGALATATNQATGKDPFADLVGLF